MGLYATRHGMQAPPTIEKYFFLGQYSEVLLSTVDSPSQGAQLSFRGNMGWVVGALSFTGRVDEAEALFKSQGPKATKRERVQARFFLGVGFSRQSKYDKARSYFGANLKEKDQNLKLNGELRFFIYQGLAFSRYFSGRYRAARWASTQAYEAAMSGFLYGKVLSADIQGHIQVQLGDLALGIGTLKKAIHFAQLLGNAAVKDAIQISILFYQSEYGIDPKKTLSSLRGALKNLSPQDTYSRSTLLLELARQYMLRGAVQDSLSTLDSAGELIYSSQNRRQEVLLNLRYAYLHFLSGESARALSFIHSAKKSLDTSVDHALELSTLGLEAKILKSLGKSTIQTERVLRMSEIYGSSNQRKMTERDSGLPLKMNRVGGDPLGALKDELGKPQDQTLEKILRTEYLSFLYELLNLPRNTQTIYLDLTPGSVTLFDRGFVAHQEGLTALGRSILVQIQSGAGSKKQLVEKIWKYEYHPLRHDPVVYSAVTMLRKTLGLRSQWIETTEEGYRLASGLQISSVRQDDRSGPVQTLDPLFDSPNINLRQIKILRYLQKSESIDSRTCKKLFRTSEITACRDLSLLNNQGLVLRVGRGRSTQYILKNRM